MNNNSVKAQALVVSLNLTFKSNQISLLSHIMYTSVLVVKFLGTRLRSMAVQATLYEKFTIYINNNIQCTHFTQLHNIQ